MAKSEEGTDKEQVPATRRGIHKGVMDKMVHDQMKELVKEALKEAYDPKPKKRESRGPETCCPYDDQSRIVENGMANDRVIFEQKGKTYSQGFEIASGKAKLLGSRQQVMVTWTPVPGGSTGEEETEEGEGPDQDRDLTRLNKETEPAQEEKKEA